MAPGVWQKGTCGLLLSTENFKCSPSKSSMTTIKEPLPTHKEIEGVAILVYTLCQYTTTSCQLGRRVNPTRYTIWLSAPKGFLLAIWPTWSLQNPAPWHELSLFQMVKRLAEAQDLISATILFGLRLQMWELKPNCAYISFYTGLAHLDDSSWNPVTCIYNDQLYMQVESFFFFFF